MRRVDSLEKTLILGGIVGQEEKGTTEAEMAGWHHWLDGREFGWTPGVSVGQGDLACCNSWGRKEWDTTESLNWTELMSYWFFFSYIPLFLIPSVSWQVKAKCWCNSGHLLLIFDKKYFIGALCTFFFIILRGRWYVCLVFSNLIMLALLVGFMLQSSSLTFIY